MPSTYSSSRARSESERGRGDLFRLEASMSIVAKESCPLYLFQVRPCSVPPRETSRIPRGWWRARGLIVLWRGGPAKRGAVSGEAQGDARVLND